MAIVPAPIEQALLGAFAKDLEDRLFQAARDKIVPGIEAEIRQVARTTVARLSVAISARHDRFSQEATLLVSINGAPPEVVP